MNTSWHVATAAEALAAAQISRCGWDISVQYGANQPEYDLVAVKGDRMLKISVKGSQDGAWGLTQSYLKNADYKAAAKNWLGRHSNSTILCFVQFYETQITDLPRMYLARAEEVATWLEAAAAGRGSTVLYETKLWSKRAQACGTTDAIPASWKFTRERLEELARSL